MFYDMLEQPHRAFKSKNGLAVACPQMPLWLWLAQGQPTDVRLFFNDFLRQNTTPLIGLVAERDSAKICAEIYATEAGVSFSQKDLVAYFLPEDAQLPYPTAAGELRPACAADMAFIPKWISEFYAEALEFSFADIPPPQATEFFEKTPPPKSLNLFVWHDEKPVAMGAITGKTCRLNLIYVTPAARGKGYGRAIVCALARKARESGKLPVLYTSGGNDAAMGLYLSLGFRETGRLSEVRFSCCANAPNML